MNIEIAVVGHDKTKFPKIKSPILKPAILHELDYSKTEYSNNSLGESRFFLANDFFSPKAEIVGCLTASWDKKYNPNILDNIEYWPQAGHFAEMLTENTVMCATVCYGKLAKHRSPLYEKNFQRHFRLLWPETTWVQETILDITGMSYTSGSICPYSNQIICNVSLFNKLCLFVKSIIDEIIIRFTLNPKIYGKEIDQNRTLAYIMEEVTMLWWSNQPNIQYIQCGRINPGWYK